MNGIAIPYPEKRKALILVDIERDFIRKSDDTIIKNIESLIAKEPYDAYVETVFGTKKNLLWKKQVNWTFPLEQTIHVIRSLLPDKKTLHVKKDTKSVFKGNKDVCAFLKKHHIEVIHIVGFDTNDCVYASAQESFDLGFPTYVIEECTGSSESQKLKDEALDILRENEMTNHSPFINDQHIITQ